MRVPVLAALTFTLLSCTQSFPLPAGAQLSCSKDEECPDMLLCDPELLLCVSTIIQPPSFTLKVEPSEGNRSTLFTFTSEAVNAGALRYRWELLRDGTDQATVLVADGGPTLTQRFALTKDDFCTPSGACVASVARTVRLTVTNEGGKKAERQVPVVVRNVAPIADFGEDLFVSELGVPEVELDLCGGVRVDGGCTSHDPDGEDIAFSGFELVGGASVMLRDAGPHRVRFTPPANWQRPLVFRGVVTDGIESATGSIRVYRGAHAWVTSGLFDQTYRLHPDLRTDTAWRRAGGGVTFYSPEAIVSDGQGGWWFGDSDDSTPNTGPTYVVHLDRGLNELERWEIPNSSDDFVEAVPSLVPPRGSVPGCMALRHFTGGAIDSQSGFVRFTAGPSQTTLTYSLPLMSDGGVRSPLGVLPVGTTGDCWAIGQGPNGQPTFQSTGGQLGKVHADGTWTPIAMLAGFPGAWAAEADGTLWIAERFPIPAPDGGFYPPFVGSYRTELRRFTPSGTSSTVDVTGRFFTQLAAHPAGGLWALDVPSHSLVRVWPDGTTTQAATIPLGNGSVFQPPGLAVDAQGTAVWVTNLLADQLDRFDEAPDGGLTLSSTLTTADLPPGVNRKGFTGRIAVDPATGTATTFVGAVSNIYARWVTVPPHARRLENSASKTVEAKRLVGDPTTGHEWAIDKNALRRFDIKGRLLLEVPNQWIVSQVQPPLIVDRRGRAWVATIEGGSALRVIDTNGAEVQRIALPFTPTFMALGSSMQGEAPREFACGVGPNGELMRLDLSSPTPQVLTVPQSNLVHLCAPTSTGRMWVLTNQGGPTHRAFLFEPGATSPGAPVVLRDDVSPELVYVMTAAIDESTGDLFFTTWDQTSYFSELFRVDLAGNRTLVRMLQGGGNLGIAVGLGLRRVCPAPASGCLELWVANRLSEVHRYDLAGNDLESFVFDRVEPVMSLVP